MVRPRTMCLLLALVTVLAYLPARHAGFVVFDDPVYVGDIHVKAGLTAAGIKWAFTTWHGSNWHPLTWISHMIDASLFGGDPGPQHFVNVLFHAANAVLLFLLLWRMTRKLWPAAFVAALFALHPVHVESVAWLSERKDVLSTFFGLLTLLAYAKYAHASNIGNAPSKSRGKVGSNSKAWYGCALLLFALSLMAKAMLVTMPFVMLLLDIWPLQRAQLLEISEGSKTRDTQHGARTTLPKLILEKAPFFVLTVASSVVTFLAQRSEAVVSLEQRPFGLRIENTLVAYARYLGKIVWPTKLSIVYPLPHEIPAWQIAGAAVILVFLSVLVWISRKRNPYLLIGWLWFLGTLVPVIGLVQVGGQALADRYTYVPSIGIFIALAYGAADLAARFRISVVAASSIAAITLFVCVGLTEYQLRFWQNSETLFTHALAVTKENAIAHINLGVALEQDNQPDAAAGQYREAINIEPGRFQPHNNLANLLAAKGERAEAFKEYQEALKLDPKAALAHVNFATLLVDMGRFDDAMHEYAEGAKLAPEDPRPHYLMGKAELRHGQSAEAVKHFHDALQLDPNDFKTLTWLARVLASDRDAAVRNGAQAVSFAEQANDMTGGEQPFVLDTLAMAYAEAGRFSEAQATVQKAIDRANAAGAQKTVPEMQKRLQLYQSGKPYREDFTKAASGF
ncbi:MAG TPA: tetratricopeptide repeat protein [Candidatus Angelobacter sp.]|nr:tetratricopeptide repeat protein [Candidatus Angelobacter sp.]